MRTSSSASDPLPCASRFTRLKSRRNCAVRLIDRPRRPPCRASAQSSRLSSAITSAGVPSSTTSPPCAASTASMVVGFGTSAPRSGPHPADADSSTMRAVSSIARPCAQKCCLADSSRTCRSTSTRTVTFIFATVKRH